MSEWNYLTTKPFQMRYVLAAHLVNHELHVVEIGCYRNTVVDYLKGSRMSVTTIDVLRDSTTVRKDARFGTIFTLGGYFQDHMDLLPKSNFGLVALGLEIKGDFAPFIDLVNRSSVTVIEFPVDWTPSVAQFKRVLVESNKQVRMTIGLDFSENDYSGLTGYPVRPHRVLYELR